MTRTQESAPAHRGRTTVMAATAPPIAKIAGRWTSAVTSRSPSWAARVAEDGSRGQRHARGEDEEQAE